MSWTIFLTVLLKCLRTCRHISVEDIEWLMLFCISSLLIIDHIVWVPRSLYWRLKSSGHATDPIWWWQVEGRDEWTWYLVTKFGCNLNICSVHEKEFSKKWVGSLNNWYNPYCEIILNSFIFETGFILTVPVFRFCVKISSGFH